MDVAIAGGHGQIALRLERLLSAGGHRCRAIVRNPDHGTDVIAAGAEPIVLDLEAIGGVHDLTDAVRGADAVVFAAGAGPGSGPERKRTVDYGAAVKLLAAAEAAGIDRYVMISTLGADRPDARGDAMRPYFAAKADAEAALRASGLAWTIVRPGSLTDEHGTGRVTVAEHLDRWGSVPRDDVAAVLLATLVGAAATGRTIEVVSGDLPVADALAALG
ncbi:MAG TPA: SDR family oxidoreductase [Acidimicrobiales bacterium]|nr:SDR family oxidoreductase [Acidimicrobiales bacterium]